MTITIKDAAHLYFRRTTSPHYSAHHPNSTLHYYIVLLHQQIIKSLRKNHLW